MTVLMYVIVNGKVAFWFQCGLQSWVSKVFSHLVNKFLKEKVCDFRDFQVIKNIELCSYSESIYGESFPLTQVRSLNLGLVWNWHMLSFSFERVFCWLNILQGLILCGIREESGSSKGKGLSTCISGMMAMLK